VESYHTIKVSLSNDLLFRARFLCLLRCLNDLINTKMKGMQATNKVGMAMMASGDMPCILTINKSRPREMQNYLVRDAYLSIYKHLSKLHDSNVAA
jgi:hypothetical protein